MDDRIKESISALMDDEANELEMQRLLSKASSEEVLDTWKRYHQSRELMAGLSDRAGDHLNIDVSASVSAAIRGQDDASMQQADAGSPTEPSDEFSQVVTAAVENYNDQAVSARRTWLHFGGGIAACLVVALGVMFNLSGTVTEPSYESRLVVNTLQADQVKTFNRYLLRHSERSAVKVSSTMAPLIRVASVNSVGI